MSDNKIKIKAEFDRNLIYEGGHSVRYLAVEVAAPDVREKNERTPLNLAIVIDASGSMAGAPMNAAKVAAIGVIEGCNEDDVLSIVSFSQDAIVHVNALPMTQKNKSAATAAVELLRTRNSTNLSAGWFKGVECVATFMEEQAEKFHTHVVILSDGHANEGILNPRELEEHAYQLCRRGVYTSTVGIGDHYSATQMQALAECGGGRMHDAQRPQEIIEVVLGQLRELRELAVENVALSLAFPYEVRAENVSGMMTRQLDNCLITQLGALTALGTRVALFRLKLKEGHRGRQLEFHIKLNWTSCGSETVEEANCTATLTYASEKDNVGQDVDSRLGMKIARLWQAAVVREIMDLNREKKYELAKQRLDREIKYLKRYCNILQEANGLLRDLKLLRQVVDRDFDERSRKDAQYSTYTTSYGLDDHRTSSRGHWTDSLRLRTSSEDDTY